MRKSAVYMSLLLAFGVAGAKAEAVDFVQEGLTLSLDAAARVTSLTGADGRELVARPVAFAALTPSVSAVETAATAVERRAEPIGDAPSR